MPRPEQPRRRSLPAGLLQGAERATPVRAALLPLSAAAARDRPGPKAAVATIGSSPRRTLLRTRVTPTHARILLIYRHLVAAKAMLHLAGDPVAPPGRASVSPLTHWAPPIGTQGARGEAWRGGLPRGWRFAGAVGRDRRRPRVGLLERQQKAGQLVLVAARFVSPGLSPGDTHISGSDKGDLERAKGFEPSTLTLAT
jgi:hypothetical protein